MTDWLVLYALGRPVVKLLAHVSVPPRKKKGPKPLFLNVTNRPFAMRMTSGLCPAAAWSQLEKAGIPVIARPKINACTSCVPS